MDAKGKKLLMTTLQEQARPRRKTLPPHVAKRLPSMNERDRRAVLTYYGVASA